MPVYEHKEELYDNDLSRHIERHPSSRRAD
jgi:hypothetical protein